MKTKAKTIYLKRLEHIRGQEAGNRLASVLKLCQKFLSSQYSVDTVLHRLENIKLTPTRRTP